MEYKKETIANVKLGNIKNAALFFDYVIPISGRSLALSIGFDSIKEKYDSVLNSILPIDLKKGGVNHDYYNKVLREAESLRLTSKHYFKLGMYLDEAIKEEGIDFRKPFNKACSLLESKSHSYKYSTQIEFDNQQNKYLDGEDVFVSIMNMRIVDVYKTSWEQILEFREDEISKRILED
ncbi:MAG: hypothetical protein JWO58_325 [Chitinophagaceae bacterium]|nr:hypothetical protein [Chitinophagaceae bacterium]